MIKTVTSTHNSNNNNNNNYNNNYNINNVCLHRMSSDIDHLQNNSRDFELFFTENKGWHIIQMFFKMRQFE